MDKLLKKALEVGYMGLSKAEQKELKTRVGIISVDFKDESGGGGPIWISLKPTYTDDFLEDTQNYSINYQNGPTKKSRDIDSTECPFYAKWFPHTTAVKLAKTLGVSLQD